MYGLGQKKHTDCGTAVYAKEFTNVVIDVDTFERTEPLKIGFYNVQFFPMVRVTAITAMRSET